MCIIESLCCTAEIKHNVVNLLFNAIKDKLFQAVEIIFKQQQKQILKCIKIVNY